MFKSTLDQTTTHSGSNDNSLWIKRQLITKKTYTTMTFVSLNDTPRKALNEIDNNATPDEKMQISALLENIITHIVSQSATQETVEAAKEVAEIVVNVMASTMKVIANGCTNGPEVIYAEEEEAEVLQKIEETILYACTDVKAVGGKVAAEAATDAGKKMAMMVTETNVQPSKNVVTMEAKKVAEKVVDAMTAVMNIWVADCEEEAREIRASGPNMDEDEDDVEKKAQVATRAADEITFTREMAIDAGKKAMIEWLVPRKNA